jgi:DAK2 domain fusion protein YloV
MTLRTDAGSQTRGCGGDELLRALRYAAAWLERHAAALDALNVFPVPDGDTGLNMSVTLRAAVAAAEECEGTLAVVAQAAARGALMGARGNSGVILSQLLRGFAESLADAEALTPPLLAAGLIAAAAAAYRAVLQPVEGTILTVAREAAAAAQRAALSGASLVDVLAAAAAAAAVAVQRTPEQLAVLREAGVVDAGGQGYAVLLEGLLRGLRGEPLDADLQIPLTTQRPLHAPGEEGHGYCTEFVITGSGLDVDAIRAAISELGTSVLVVGDPTAVRVHVHALDPGAVLSYGVAQGTLTRIKIDNMDEQRATFARQGAGSRVASPATGIQMLPIVAVVAGAGFADVYRSLGATCVVVDERATNPSVAELARAIGALDAPEVLVLPNDPNVVPAAEQAASAAQRTVLVVPTRNMAEGIAALMAYSPLATGSANATAMRDAATRARTARVTWAARDARIGGVPVTAGTALALADKTLIAHGSDVAAVIVDALTRLGAADAEVITLYAGRTVAPDEAQALADRVRACWPKATVEVVRGEQPHDYYLLAVE